MKAWEDTDRDRLEFPIGGKTYVIPELPYQAMLTLEKAKAGEKTYLDDAPPEETWRIVMGHVYDDMVTDNVPGEALMRAGLAALAFFEFGREVAEAVWETGIDPKALSAAIQAQAQGREGSTPSPSSGAASSTRKRASSSGTTSRRATPPAAGSKTTTTRKPARSRS